jgi:hypothetical protein
VLEGILDVFYLPLFCHSSKLPAKFSALSKTSCT